MREKASALAFDFGAGSGRAILGTLEDGRIAMQTVRRFSNEPVRMSGTLYWDTLYHFWQIQQGIRDACRREDVGSIGIDTWGVDFVFLDSHGELLESAVHYRDERTAGMPEQVFRLIPSAELYRRTGIQFEDFNTIYQLYSVRLRRPWLLERAKTFLLLPDLFNYLLTGVQLSEQSISSTTQLMRAAQPDWDRPLLDALSLPETLFPPIVPSGTVLGPLRPDLCRALAVPEIPVVAVAGHDTQSAVVAVPAEEEPFLFLSSGTWSLLGTELPAPVVSEETFRCGLSNEQGFGGTTTLLKNIAGLWLVQECRRAWQEQGAGLSYDEMEAAAARAEPFRSLIDPDDPVFAAPGDVPARIADYCRRRGQPVPETPGQLVRCIYESLAFKYRLCAEQICRCAGISCSVIHVVGGGSNSNLLCSMTADACGMRVTAGPTEATALGNLAVQFIARGLLGGIAQARAVVRASEPVREFLPRDSGPWDKAYQRFCSIVQNGKE